MKRIWKRIHTDTHISDSLCRTTETNTALWISYLLLFSCSVVSDSFVTPWTVVRQTPLSVGFPRQEYWEILPFSPSRGSSQLRDWTPISMCPALQVDFCHWATWGSPLHLRFLKIKYSLKKEPLQVTQKHIQVSELLFSLNAGRLTDGKSDCDLLELIPL